MKNGVKILLIDDDEKLGGLLSDFFEGFGFQLRTAHHPREGLKKLNTEKPDIVILDVMMPDMDGFEVCREIRKSSNIPIIMLTARGDTTDRIVGLELGADDYLPKPFEPRELVARIQSILRRWNGTPSDSKISFGELELDPEKRIVHLDGETLSLTTMEYELLLLFAKHPGKKFDRDEIMNHLQGIDSSVFSRSIDILVSRVRQKIGDSSKTPRYIQTVWGTGYVFLGNRHEA